MDKISVRCMLTVEILFVHLVLIDWVDLVTSAILYRTKFTNNTLCYCGNPLITRISQFQGRSQPHSPGWARVPLSSFFPQISIKFSYFSSNFYSFLPHFGPPGGRVAHPGRPWLRHCPIPSYEAVTSTFSLKYLCYTRIP